MSEAAHPAPDNGRVVAGSGSAGSAAVKRHVADTTHVVFRGPGPAGHGCSTRAHKPRVRMGFQTQTQECGVRTVPVFDLDLHLSPHVVVVHGVVERVSQSFQLVVWTAAAASRCRAAPRGDGMAPDTPAAFYELTTNPPRSVALLKYSLTCHSRLRRCWPAWHHRSRRSCSPLASRPRRTCRPPRRCCRRRCRG